MRGNRQRHRPQPRQRTAGKIPLRRIVAAAAENVGGGGVPVDLFTLLGTRFREAGMFAADGYHPSAAGYAAAAEVLLPAVCGALESALDRPPEADAA